MEGVRLHTRADGTIDWTKVSQYVGTKDNNQVFHRWSLNLNPALTLLQQGPMEEAEVQHMYNKNVNMI